MKSSQFDEQETETWTILFDQQMSALPGRCRPEYFAAVEALGLRRDTVPTLGWLNERMQHLTGWTFIEAQGSLKTVDFLEMTASRRFPVSDRMRPRDSLPHAKIPDIFHDVVGHVPLLAIPVFSDYLVRISAAALHRRDSKIAMQQFSRVIAWTVEFGLMGDVNQPQVYGAGLITSLEELIHVLGPAPTRHPFEPVRVIMTSHASAELQDEYFVVGSFDELFDSVAEFMALVPLGTAASG